MVVGGSAVLEGLECEGLGGLHEQGFVEGGEGLERRIGAIAADAGEVGVGDVEVLEGGVEGVERRRKV